MVVLVAAALCAIVVYTVVRIVIPSWSELPAPLRILAPVVLVGIVIGAVGMPLGWHWVGPLAAALGVTGGLAALWTIHYLNTRRGQGA